MAVYSALRIDNFISQGANKALTTKERGDALEQLFCYLLDKLPGVRTRCNGVDYFQSSEIDIAVANAKVAQWLRPFPHLFLVECKNWDQPVDSAAVAAFILKLTERCVELGIIVAANGITGNDEDLRAAHHKIAMAQQANRRVIVVTMEHLQGVRTTEQFESLLCDRMLATVASGSFLAKS